MKPTQQLVPRRSSRIAIGLAIGLATASAASAATDSFARWLRGVHREAQAAGVPSHILDRALGDLRPNPRVLELDRRQPEGTLSFRDYLRRVVPEKRVSDGKRLLEQHRSLLQRIAKRFGVQPRFIVALWGIESDFGRRPGEFPIIESLATLAYDGRRSEFFRSELIEALRILDRENIPPDRMTGSWAGAMGQNQFMPSSFRRFAADGNGDGHRDIWRSTADVFASTANYLSHFGWNDDQTWGRQVRLPSKFNWRRAEGERSLVEWAKLGVRAIDGGPLPHRPDLHARLVLPDGLSGPAFLVYGNYKVLLRWNPSTYFAVAVGRLADAIGDG